MRGAAIVNINERLRGKKILPFWPIQGCHLRGKMGGVPLR
jgi:hypothetical protein